LTGKSKISRSQRLIATAVLVALSSALAGCGGGLNNFDPTDMLDFLDTKKKLPGERKPVFPEGVPGLEQGVPKELYKGAQQQPDEQSVQAAPAAAASPVEEPKTKRLSRSKAKSPPVSSTPPAQPAETEAAPEEDGSTTAAPPAPKPKPSKVAHKRANSLSSDNKSAAPAPATGQAQPAQQNQAAPAFPAPLPSGSFSR